MGPRRRRRRRLLRKLLVGLLGLLLVVVVLTGVLYESAPRVADAERRVRHALQEHGGRDTDLPAPRRVAAATVAIEDRRFYGHGAVDPRALLRALGTSVLGNAGDPGGSTLSQQLAKVLYGSGSGGAAKLTDLAVAFKLEHRYSKPRILEMYLNAVYYGHGAYGLAAASHVYFGESPSQLDWGEASMLAGLLQAPSVLDPIEHFARARKRQRAVLKALIQMGTLTVRQAGAAFAELGRFGDRGR